MYVCNVKITFLPNVDDNKKNSNLKFIKNNLFVPDVN